MKEKNYSRITFVDFMYAIVVGTAFSRIKALELNFEFLGTIFLIVVILEDFYLYHTQIAPHEVRRKPVVLGALLFEIGILFAWWLSVISFPDNGGAFLLCFAVFFLLKWLAGAAHWWAVGAGYNWRFHRSHTFWIPVVTCFGLRVFLRSYALDNPAIWIPVLFTWAIQTTTWWAITRGKSAAESVER